MIISASRRTDIPAFFGAWFIRRIKEGFFYSINPFNPKQVKGYSLAPSDVDVIVFWSKHPEPFLRHLEYLDAKGYDYYFLFTLNDYPKVLEPHMPPLCRRIRTFQRLSDRIGPEKVIWRYDPIILSSITPIDYHVEKLSHIARILQGHTHRLIISFLTLYSKVQKRLKKVALENSMEFFDIRTSSRRAELLSLAREIREIGEKHGLDVRSCAEPVELEEIGIRHGACIDGNLIRQLFNMDKNFPKDKGQRAECLCADSVDVGVYDTCKFQCTYCYANYSERSIRSNLSKYGVNNPALIRHGGEAVDIAKEKRTGWVS